MGTLTGLEPIWEVIVALSVIGGAMGALWFTRARIQDSIRFAREWARPNLLTGIFGEGADVEVVTTNELEELTVENANNATHSVDRIHNHMKTVVRRENNAFFDSNVNHRILLLKPESDGDTGEVTGWEALRNSPFDPDGMKDRADYEEPFEHFYRKLQDDWQNVEIRVYETTPWLRASIIDQRKAGFILLPSLQSGRRAAKFWTEDNDVVEGLHSIFEDIWTDPRTRDFREWFEEWSESAAEPDLE